MLTSASSTVICRHQSNLPSIPVICHHIMPRQLEEKSMPHLLQEQVQLRVGGGVLGDLEQGGEDVVQHLLERLDDALLLVHRVQPRDLHECMCHVI